MPGPAYIEAWLPGLDGHQFYTRTYPATFPKAVVLFAHAFSDHIARHADVHANFAQRHITVFAYDLRGYGRTALDTDHRSPGAAFGKTNRAAEIADLEWWIKHVASSQQGQPIFLMGYGAGGGLSLVFSTCEKPPPTRETMSSLAGVITVSPLIKMTTPPTKVARHISRTVSSILPSLPFSWRAVPEQLSRDPTVISSISNDPYLKQGRAQAKWKMIQQGEQLLESGWKRWPESLPLLMLWGTANQVNSPAAGMAFFDEVGIADKKLVTYQDALDDLLHEAGDIATRVLDECVTWIENHIQREESVAA